MATQREATMQARLELDGNRRRTGGGRTGAVRGGPAWSLALWPAVVLVLVVAVSLGGCAPKLYEGLITSSAVVPYVDRTEAEIEHWFANRPIVDDGPPSSGTAINGDPQVLLIARGQRLEVGGTNYPGTLCVTQTNTLQGNNQVKYAALLGLKPVDGPELFEVGEVEISETACDGDLQLVNVAVLHTKRDLESLFRTAVDTWLRDDVVAQLKSATNREGLARPTAPPRQPATTRGSLYGITEGGGPPPVRTIGFVAN